MIAALRATAALAVMLALTSAVAEACVTCIASAYGDRTFNWAFLSLLLAPFAVAAGIGGVLFLAYRRTAGGLRSRHEKVDTTPHRLSKETT